MYSPTSFRRLLAASSVLTLFSAAAAHAQTDVLTWHNDNLRTGANLTEAILTPATATSANPGRHGGPAETGTEEWQAEKLRRHWRQVTDRAGYLAGYTYWLLRDYKQRMNYNHDLNGISAMGLITFTGHRRAAYATFRDCQNPSR